MIFNFIAKNIRFILDALLVVGLVVLFAWFDPFGWFKSKPQLEDTAILVSNVKEIGELITAEYYGEVIASLKESRIEAYEEDTLVTWAEELFIDLKYAIYQLQQSENRIRRKRIDDLVLKADPELARNFLYPYLLDYLDSLPQIDNRNDRQHSILWALAITIESQTKDKEPEEIYRYLNEPDPAPGFKGFSAFYKNQLGLNIKDDRRERRKEVTFIGRGWVKAGFNLSQLNQRNFIYDEDNHVIHILGMNPQILAAEINPWFIPERGIQGFELVTLKGRANFEDAILVKSHCKEKLRQQALNSGLLEQARKNGQENLQKFFSLLLDEPIQAVTFHTNELHYMQRTLLQDSIIGFQEALVIDSLFKKQIRNLANTTHKKLRNRQLEQIQEFVNTMQQQKFVDSLQLNFNYYSPWVTRLFWDNASPEAIDSLECIQIQNLKSGTLTLPADTLWFTGDQAKNAALHEFNQTFKVLDIGLDTLGCW